MFAKKTEESDKFKDFIKCFDATEGLEKDTLVVVLKQLLDDAYEEGKDSLYRTSVESTSGAFVTYFCRKWDKFKKLVKHFDNSTEPDDMYLAIQMFCEKFFEFGRAVGEAECLNRFAHHFFNAEELLRMDIDRFINESEE